MKNRDSLIEVRRIVESIRGNGRGDTGRKDRALRRIDTVLRTNPAKPEAPKVPTGPLDAVFLKRNAKRGMYPETTLDFLAWSPARQLEFLESSPEKDVAFYVRALDWPGLFDGRKPTFDFYKDGGHMVVIAGIEKIHAAGKRAVPILLDNTEHKHHPGKWKSYHLPRLVAGLKAWGHLVDDVLLGIELNPLFETFRGDDVPVETYVSDALGHQVEPGHATGLKITFPDIAFGVHFKPGPYLFCRHADWYGHQFPWDSHQMSPAAVAAEMRTVKAAAGKKPVVWFEYAQHVNATELDAQRMRGWVAGNDPDGGRGC